MSQRSNAQPIIPPDLREKPRRPVNSDVGHQDIEFGLVVNSNQAGLRNAGVRMFRRSKCGWLFSIGYVVVASILFYQALTCSGWGCDLVALPAAFPLGFPIAWLTDWIDSWFLFPGHTPSFHLRNWYFIIPTLIANSLFYYWLGKFIGVVTHKVLSGGKEIR